MSHPIGENKDNCVIGFDIWGTLLDLDRVLIYIGEIISEDLGLNREESVKLIFKIHDEARSIRRYNPDISVHDLMKISSRLIEEAFNAPMNRVGGSIEKAFSRVGRDALYADTLPALQSLRDYGIKMGLIGNVLFWPSAYTRLLLEELRLSEFFDESVFSDEVNVSKPDRKIFIEFSKRIGIDPSKIIYVGDNVIEDVGGALSSGGFGVLIKRDSTNVVIVRELRVAMINSLTQLVDIYRTVCGDRLV